MSYLNITPSTETCSPTISVAGSDSAISTPTPLATIPSYQRRYHHRSLTPEPDTASEVEPDVPYPDRNIDIYNTFCLMRSNPMFNLHGWCHTCSWNHTHCNVYSDPFGETFCVWRDHV